MSFPLSRAVLVGGFAFVLVFALQDKLFRDAYSTYVVAPMLALMVGTGWDMSAPSFRWLYLTIYLFPALACGAAAFLAMWLQHGYQQLQRRLE